MTDARLQPFVTATSVVLATLAAFALHLESTWWAAISAWIVANPEGKLVFRKGIYRILGTLAGALVGFWIASLMEGLVLLQATYVAFAFAMAAYARFTAEHAYAWAMFWMVTVLTVVMSFQNYSETGSFVYNRSVEICIGVFVVMIVSLLVAPFRVAKTDPAARSDVDTAAIRDNTAIAAVFGGIAVVLILVLWQAFNLPSLVQMVISLFVAIAPSIAQMRQQIAQRFAGCLIGGTLGLFITGLGIEILWIWAFLLFAGIYAASFVHHGDPSRSYIGTQAGVAYILCMVSGAGPQTSIMPVVDRAAGIALVFVLLGVLLFTVGPWLHWMAARLRKRRAARSSQTHAEPLAVD